MVEICAFSLESCQIAQKANADRIELCGGMNEGGTTPSAGLVGLACQNIQIPIRLMLRPRGGDFCYSETEWQVIYADFEAYHSSGVEGFVLGALKPNGEIDTENLSKFLSMARHKNPALKFTFHRAFDVCKDPFIALEQLIELKFDTILTSGQKNFAIEGLPLLQILLQKAKNRINIMAGSGINSQNIEQFMNVGIRHFHLTGKGSKASKMIYRKTDVSMASSLSTNEFEIYEADFDKCSEAIKKQIIH
jgi:copper homeostasis protein